MLIGILALIAWLYTWITAFQGKEVRLPIIAISRRDSSARNLLRFSSPRRCRRPADFRFAVATRFRGLASTTGSTRLDTPR